MFKHVGMVAAFLMISVGVVAAQAPPPAASPNAAAVAAARNLVTTMKMADQFKALLPIIMTGIKPAIVQNRPEVERDLDAMMPKLLASFEPYYNQMVDGIVSVYATNFSAEELTEIDAFYHRPIGQKMLEKMPTIMQQSMQVGQLFGQKAAADIRDVAIEELRKKGHKI